MIAAAKHGNDTCLLKVSVTLPAISADLNLSNLISCHMCRCALYDPYNDLILNSKNLANYNLSLQIDCSRKNFVFLVGA